MVMIIQTTPRTIYVLKIAAVRANWGICLRLGIVRITLKPTASLNAIVFQGVMDLITIQARVLAIIWFSRNRF